MNLDSNDDDSEESDFLSIAGEDVDVHLNHYRDYCVPRLLYDLNNPPKARGYKEQVKWCNEGKIMTLTELAAQKVACHLPFGLVEHFDPPVPEPMQCRIAYWSFPQDEEDVKLYTCLANGNADFFYEAEELVQQRAVRDMLQVGFHLSANVQYLGETENPEVFRVALTFDRRRITSCSCSCQLSTFWCQHVVAVCLQRICSPQEVKLRAPVSESLHRLEKNQLQKFAQYLINELPQQILPAAQKLLDELLSGNEAVINQNPAAPDPTAGATINEQTSWCLDYTHLRLDINRILLKQCTAQPTVCSDIQSLHVTAPPTTTEYSQLLRPICGREPEGIWNLISIVGEMMNRRDSNFFTLLEIMTEEVLKFDKIITWWFETKVSLHLGSSIHVSSVKNSQCTSQYSCSNFCDEIVHLWRLAALDPESKDDEKQKLFKKFNSWHLSILERHNSMSENVFSGLIKTSKRNLLEVFPGFKSAMEGCNIIWSDWDEKRSMLVIDDFAKPVKTIKKRKRRKFKNSTAESKPPISEESVADTDQKPTLDEGEKHQEAEVNDKENLPLANIANEQDARPSHSNNNREPLVNNDLNQEDRDLQVYFMERPEDNSEKDHMPEALDDLIAVNRRRLADPLETLYAKIEGLYAHGYTEEARRIALILAVEILNRKNYPSVKQLFTLPRRRKKKGSLDNQMSIVSSETLSRVNFLCNVLSEDPANHSLIFRLVMFGIELKRAPAATQPLEVKLINQKRELVLLLKLKKITLGEKELATLRDKATNLCDVDNNEQMDTLTILILGNYIFESLVLSRQTKLPSDANLGFQSALFALGTKMNISETDHPLLCEGVRRQRGELAMALIYHYKDDQEKLDSILKQFLDKDLIESQEDVNKSPPTSKKNTSASEMNQPTEAAAHFMFELSKDLFDKAGGNSTTAHLFRPQVVTQNGGRGIHRKLHMCSLRIALYALGLHNRTSPNWMQRTYNGRASFIHEQALEIGLAAIKFLCENWEGYLTPVETASIADKAGCSDDPETKRIAAELAKSCLKYANFLNENAVSRILYQCKEQTIEMVEGACTEIERIAETETICTDVLFATSRTWHALYMKLFTNDRHCPNGNLYQMNNFVSNTHQDTGAGDWLAAANQSHIEKYTVLDASHSLLMYPADRSHMSWEDYTRSKFIPTSDTPTYKNIEYVRNAFRVGIKALDWLKMSLHVGSKHNPKKIDEILWLLGISKALGLSYLYEFTNSVHKNIGDPYTLHIIFIELMRILQFFNCPETHLDRDNLLMPIYYKCRDRCMKKTKDLMMRVSYDQKPCLEIILEVVQTLTLVTQKLDMAQYYWNILQFIEDKLDKRNNRRHRFYININERKIWIQKFTQDLKSCRCSQCLEVRNIRQGICPAWCSNPSIN